MKKLILLVIIALGSIDAYGQPYYKDASGSYTVQTESGPVLYKYTTSSPQIFLYRSDNRFTGVSSSMKDGSLLSSDIIEGRDPEYVKRVEIRDIIKRMVYAGLPASVKERVEPLDLFIRLCIDTSTGRIGEVQFEFRKRSAYTEMPPEYFYDLEDQIKSDARLHWELTPTGRNMNFIDRYWSEDFPD